MIYRQSYFSVDHLVFVAHASYEWKARKFGCIGSEITVRRPKCFLTLAVHLNLIPKKDNLQAIK